MRLRTTSLGVSRFWQIFQGLNNYQRHLLHVSLFELRRNCFWQMETATVTATATMTAKTTSGAPWRRPTTTATRCPATCPRGAAAPWTRLTSLWGKPAEKRPPRLWTRQVSHFTSFENPCCNYEKLVPLMPRPPFLDYIFPPSISPLKVEHGTAREHITHLLFAEYIVFPFFYPW